jgi:iron complex transport system substrate-binding protein
MNGEALVGLSPDLVLTLQEHERLRIRLSKLRIPTLSVDHQSLAGLLQSFEGLGRALGNEVAGRLLKEKVTERLQVIARKAKAFPVKRVLLILGDTQGMNALRQVTVVGADQYFSPLLAMIGAENAYQGTMAYPFIGAEGVLQMAPDWMVVLGPSSERSEEDATTRRQQWDTLFREAGLPVPRQKTLNQDYAVIPGPDVVLLAQTLAEWFHPGLTLD